MKTQEKIIARIDLGDRIVKVTYENNTYNILLLSKFGAISKNYQYKKIVMEKFESLKNCINLTEHFIKWILKI